MNPPLYLVAGLGKTGVSVARYLHGKNKPFIAFDTRAQAQSVTEFTKEFPNVRVYTQDIPDEIIGQLSDIIASPGLPLDTPFLKKAMQMGIAVYGDIECLAREIHAPVIAITGTNGKSTVTTLVGEMAKAAGYKVAVAGNIGTPVLDMLHDAHQYDLWVLELSSFQLDLTYSLTPIAATILNVTPDHLDRHHTMEAYAQAKQRIYDKAQIALFNRDDSCTVPTGAVNRISFGIDAPEKNNWGLITQHDKIYLAKGSAYILPVESVLIKGVHNWLNALAASALADAAGISQQYIISVLTSFTGLPHRCQWVRTLDGVDWINDSKGTNIGATISAINGIGGSMQGKIVLIAGGQGKGADFSELAQPIADYVRSIVLIGEDADKIEAALANVVPIARASSLDNAVVIAKSQAKPGDVVLLSPACASLDMFRDFNHRGESFASLVNGL
ncbi:MULTISPECIES: UDP-N-acetylmuramoyl-L-alanine--D-glutamate ligase [Legionella]|uniref:UDP-N-acetylmuramoylalanine--D-glutamate ligase n=1 Tax=Legionella resiliens TaxID=2905958 RepID=A0ABS8X546_9GAMM|nr:MULTISPECIES: UDP-N-acetylmuramoyl-L-alanine--D-glutamate ligase [unclassified Legionella]MCE0724757.1 UDP-N-acetylmuramoyl-L-alanine--D-glutamate ligase [Legionella sp. 9fVS26]MCE3533911.1 UDP-N-acetylmuramoyl-L-alanine--D-glutamate ligase [Legionella sp. 8cVS16]QLZ70145.1 UDP-N-acetylmuramoyl-L-alanine--D-glutamate ligase [Legionella sp. PC1000]